MSPSDFRDKVLAKLKQRGVRVECELCGQNNWSLVDHPVAVVVTNTSGGFVIPPPQIPSAGLICNNCGNMRLLALGALDLVPEQTALKQKEPA